MPASRDPYDLVRPFQPLRHPVVFDQPRRLTDVVSWHEHMPFAFFAVAALRPRTLVELGTWKGDSYCALCQAVQTLALETRCYAVDTWEGDAHTGRYGPEILEDLRAHHDPLYGAFSHLLQRTFDEAAPQFEDGSVDLLHIDGAHSYEAVAHDVETWLPKLGERGVLLLHDTNVREADFGVWRLWDELSRRYPGFAFPHGFGLGVLAVGRDVDADFLDFLAAANSDPLAARFFSALGSRIADPDRERRARVAAEREVEAANEARAAVELELRQRQDAEDRTRAELDALRAERDRLETQLLSLDLDLANVVHSISWRVTAPLRRTKRMLRRARRASRRIRRPHLRPGSGALSFATAANGPASRTTPLVAPATRLDRHSRPRHRPRVPAAGRRIRSAPDLSPLAALPRRRRLDERAHARVPARARRRARRSRSASATPTAASRPRATARSRRPRASSSPSSTTTTSSTRTRSSNASGC